LNYIKLLNSFYDRLETNALSTSAIALWHALVHVNNKAGWRSEFTVAVSVLRIKSGLSEKSVTNARNELTQKGYIDFKSRKGNQSAIYQLVDLSVTVTDKVADSSSGNDSYSSSDKASALIKINETKQNKEDNKERVSINPFLFFEQEGFGTLSSFIGEQLGDLVDSYGETRVIEAMKESVLNGARNLKYVKAILNNPNQKRGEGNAKSSRGFGKTSGKSYEDVMRDVERDRKAWGG
jgi:DnaD/phage-associated family protein